MKSIKWFGHAGHFAGAAKCLYHLTTETNGYRISTVGEYYPDGINGSMDYFGGVDNGTYYETMVFKTTNRLCQCGCNTGMKEIKDLCELEGWRYKTAAEATNGHNKMVKKYFRKK